MSESRSCEAGKPLVVWASVEPLATLGGIGSYQRALAEAFAAGGAEIVFVEKRRDLPQTEGWQAPGQRIVATSRVGLSRRVHRVTARARETGRPVVVVLGHLHLASLLSRRLRRSPSCMLLYGSEAWARPSPRHWLRSSRAGGADCYLAVSPTTRDRFLSWAEVPEERVVVVPPTVDAGRGSGIAEPRPKAGGSVLMTLGRIPEPPRDKGHRDTLEAMPKVVKELPDAQWWIVGDGDGRAALEAEVRERGLSEHVRFFGVVDESRKQDLLAEADLFVMPSRDEGFGIVLLEAVAQHLPVLARGGDGTRDALLQGELGTLVGDSADLAVELVQTLQNPPSPGELARRARAMERHYGPARFEEGANDVFRRLTEQGRESPSRRS